MSNSVLPWLFIQGMSGSLFVTVVTILIQVFNCDYSTNPPTLKEDYNVVCWEGPHLDMARASLLGLAFYFTQTTLLPAGTFVETRREEITFTLDILYVPVFLHGSFLLKAFFAIACVMTEGFDTMRIVILLVINVLLLILNYVEQPCSLAIINHLENTVHLACVWTGASSLLFVSVWTECADTAEGEDEVNESLKQFIAMILTGWALLFISSIAIWFAQDRSVDLLIAKTFLELEYQLKRDSSVNSRVLEPFIALTLSGAESELKRGVPRDLQ